MTRNLVLERNVGILIKLLKFDYSKTNQASIRPENTFWLSFEQITFQVDTSNSAKYLISVAVLKVPCLPHDAVLPT